MRDVLVHVVLVAVACIAPQFVHAQGIALVLTGGGARGLAQIGVLRVLEQNGIRPNIVVGSSFGAIIGGLYASGYSADQIDSIMRSVDWEDITSILGDTRREALFFAQKQEWDRSLLTLRFRNFTFVSPTAIGGATRFSSLLQELLWKSAYNSETLFDRLRVRFRAVTTNLANGKAVALDHGNLADAIRASATFPLRFSPIQWGPDSLLVDGGLVANIPTEVAKSMNAEIIILVNTSTNLSAVDNLTTPFDIADQALMSAMKLRDAENIALAHIVLTPDVGSTGTFDFAEVGELIAAGEVSARGALPTIEQHLRSNGYSGNATQSRFVLPADSVICNNQTGVITVPVQGSADSAEIVYTVTAALRRCGNESAWVRSVSVTNTNAYIHVDNGVLRELSFELQDNLRRSDMEREVAVELGTPPTLAQLQRTLNNLMASDVLSDPSVRLSRHPDSGTRATIHAHDRGNQMLRIGARIDNERYTQGSLDLVHDNLFSSGVRVAVRGAISQRIGLFSTTFSMPRIGGTLWTTALRAYASFRDVWVYGPDPAAPVNEPNPLRVGERSEDRLGARFSAGRQLERNGEILAEFRYEYQRYRDLNSSTLPLYQPLATLRGVVRWDDRDHIDFATRGRTIDLFVESSIFNLSNGVSFTKLSAAASSVFTLGPISFTPSGLVGAADKTLPDADQFSLGGQDMFFGWREDQQRGRQVVSASLDARVKVPFDVFFESYVSVRYDLGAIWTNPENIRIGDMNHGIGLTFGVDTPIGPARFSAGKSFYFLSNPNSVVWGPLLAYFAIGARL